MSKTSVFHGVDDLLFVWIIGGLIFFGFIWFVCAIKSFIEREADDISDDCDTISTMSTNDTIEAEEIEGIKFTHV